MTHGVVWGTLLEVHTDDVDDMRVRLDEIRASSDMPPDRRRQALTALLRQSELALRVVDPTRSPVVLNDLLAKDPKFRDTLFFVISGGSSSAGPDSQDIAIKINQIRLATLDLLEQDAKAKPLDTVTPSSDR
jgi:hypothetical protein